MIKTWIKNREIFSLSKEREDALAIIEAGLSAVDTEEVIKQEVLFDRTNKILKIRDQNFDLAKFEHVYFVAIGKCALDAGNAVEDILDGEISNGIILDVKEGKSKYFKVVQGTHPMPSDVNVVATRRIVDLLEKATEKDLILMIISGGGSALLSSPYKIDYTTLSSITKSLMDKGATIEEINIVRKHLSNVQGGQLAKIAHPATVVGLLFSDVIGDDPSVIASGPLTKDLSTIEEAKNVLQKYGVAGQYEFIETPKEDAYFEKVKTFIVVNGGRALGAMKDKATELGYSPKIETLEMRGEARAVGALLGERKMDPGTAIFFAGETTVNVLNPTGQGGRNLEFALAALNSFTDSSNALVVSLASDGRDNCNLAGAIADKISFQKMRELNLEPQTFLATNNSEDFWTKIGAGIITGQTGINVADLAFKLESKV